LFGLGPVFLGAAHFGLEHLTNDFGVAAVDHQLDAFAHEVVVERGRLVFEGQQAFATGLFGKRDQGRNDVTFVVVDRNERGLETAEEPSYEGPHRERGQRGADRSADDQHECFPPAEDDVGIGSSDPAGDEDGSKA